MQLGQSRVGTKAADAVGAITIQQLQQAMMTKRSREVRRKNVKDRVKVTLLYL